MAKNFINLLKNIMHPSNSTNSKLSNHKEFHTQIHHNKMAAIQGDNLKAEREK